ncbi:MAG: hypothetical protein EB060_12625, partial [Proteobacteria bacterium]|nr:hypothetical protein [Pseudomonadota bacterium]
METGSLRLDQGQITAVYAASRTYEVELGFNNSTKTILTGCVWGAEAFGGLLGFKVDGVLTIGTPVLLMQSSPPLILKALPYAPADTRAHSIRKAADGTPAGEVYGDKHNPGHSSGVANHPKIDLLEGEFDIANHMGVFITFLTNMAKLGASEAAKIEFSLFDDLVRIVSGTFRHHSCMGDTEIFEHGAPSCIVEATSRSHEALGLENPGDALGDVTEGRISSWHPETLRSRYSRYEGWLGGFIHEIVTDPAAALGTLAQARAGKSRFWR